MAQQEGLKVSRRVRRAVGLREDVRIADDERTPAPEPVDQAGLPWCDVTHVFAEAHYFMLRSLEIVQQGRVAGRVIQQEDVRMACILQPPD
jgi:hypothetical protein